MIRLPSVLKSKLTISAVCPSSVWISTPVDTSHNLAVLSIEPVATTFPFLKRDKGDKGDKGGRWVGGGD